MNLALDLPTTLSSDLSEATPSNFDDLRSTMDQRLNALRPNRNPVLQQLRSQYPTGCLSADLVQVNSDQFVVRANVQVEGVTIVTALASATTVEVAEDRARSRALEALGLNVNHSAVSSNLSATLPMMPEISPELTIPPVMQPTSEPTEKSLPRTATKRKTKAQPAEPVNETPVLEPIVEPTLELAIAEPMVPVEEIANTIVEPEVVAEPEAVVEAIVEPEVIAEPEAISEPEVIASAAPIVEAEETFEISYESEEVFEYTYEEPAVEPIAEPLLEAPKAEAPKAEAPKAFTAPVAAIDLSDTIAQIGMEIDRIGWTKKQGSAYLQQEYSKRTRAELTEAELFSFLGYLKSLPAKLQPELSQIPF